MSAYHFVITVRMSTDLPPAGRFRLRQARMSRTRTRAGVADVPAGTERSEIFSQLLDDISAELSATGPDGHEHAPIVLFFSLEPEELP